MCVTVFVCTCLYTSVFVWSSVSHGYIEISKASYFIQERGSIVLETESLKQGNFAVSGAYRMVS